MVLGCAGSGKTMILLHRLSYLLFHKSIIPNNVKIITPNSDFKNNFIDIKKDLEISNIEMLTITEYFIKKLEIIDYKKRADEKIIDEYILSIQY